MGSRLHEVDGDFIIISLTQSSETGKNDENDELHESAIDTGTSVFAELFRTVRILVGTILVILNLAKIFVTEKSFPWKPRSGAT